MSVQYKVQVLLLLVMTAFTVEGRNCGVGWCDCNLKWQEATCKGHGMNLTFIPRLPSNITKLQYSRNFLPRVTAETFRNVSTLHWIRMNLTYNNISYISPGAFTVLVHLEHLSLNGNKIPSNVIAGTFSVLRQLPLVSLSLGEANLEDTSIFRQLHSNSLKSLYLDRNTLTMYNHSDFSKLSILRVLFIVNNKIEQTFLSDSSSLEILHLQHNHLRQYPVFCRNDRAYFPKLRNLRLDHNFLTTIDVKAMECLEELVTFSFDSNPLTEVEQNTFANFPILTNIMIENNRADLRIRRYAFNNSHVEYISLSSGGTVFKTNVHKDAFRGCSEMMSLDVSHNALRGTTDEDLNDWFGHLSSLTGLGFGDCKLKMFPAFITQHLLHLKYLKLYKNDIGEIPDGAFSPLNNLTHLWLNSNKMARIEETVFTITVRERLQVVDMEYNPFACNCELLWFLQWIKAENHKFPNYPEKYECYSPKSMTGQRLSEVDMTEYTCLISYSASVIFITSSSILLFSILGASLTYKWRWHIRYFLYIRKHKKIQTQALPGQEIEYDAYVIYSYGSITWIRNELIQHLEVDNDLKLYIRDRDSLAGAPIVDNVVNNMAVSRRVLVILSNAMSRDEQCQFELMFVQRQEEGERIPIILVLLEEVQAANMTQCVYALVKMHSYISWCEEHDARVLFWNRLQQSLGSGQERLPEPLN